MSTKIAIVTGGNRGIGYETSRLLTRSGVRVLVVCRDIRDATQSCSEIIQQEGVGEDMVVPLECDVSQLDKVDSLMQHILNVYGSVDILVNNAAVLLDKGESLINVSSDKLKTTFETNFFGPLYLSVKVIEQMIIRKTGRVVMVSSGAGQMDQLVDDMPIYRLSKFSLNGLTIMLANMCKDKGVVINACDPGWVQTAMGGSGADRSPVDAAGDIVNLVLSEDVVSSGGFYHKGQIVSW